MRDIAKLIRSETDDIFDIIINLSLSSREVPAREVDRVKAIIKLKLNMIYTQGQIDGMHSTIIGRKKEGE